MSIRLTQGPPHLLLTLQGYFLSLHQLARWFASLLHSGFCSNVTSSERLSPTTAPSSPLPTLPPSSSNLFFLTSSMYLFFLRVMVSSHQSGSFTGTGTFSSLLCLQSLAQGHSITSSPICSMNQVPKIPHTIHCI